MISTRVSLLALVAGLAVPGMASAEQRPAATAIAAPDPAPDAAADAPSDGDIIVTSRRTRSVTALDGGEIQKILPGVNPLKAIQTLPGVTYLTADPWGNNEQNISLFIHGFNQQQLGYTLDGIPLGDQQYGNYNGLSPQRAIISENVGRVTLASGAGDLGTASTSNLGGTIDTFSSDPHPSLGVTVAQTIGSYGASRTFVRLDTGLIDGIKAYFSGVRQDARAWDFNGRQGGYQANAKIVHDDSAGKLTLYFAYSDKKEPNEDATVITTANIATGAPYARPFFYPDFAGVEQYLASGTYAADGSNYRNYYSDAQRTDYLTYGKYDWHVDDRVTWSNTVYFHHNDGVGVVAGPINVAGLPGLFAKYFPTLTAAQLSTTFGGSGLATRTTEYRINREGIISTLQLSLGNHDIELGAWYEHQRSSAFRRWYPVDVNNPSTPYTRPREYSVPLIDQYESLVSVDEYQTHIQDSWHALPTLTVLAGVKSTFQFATQAIPVQPILGSFAGSIAFPQGRLDTKQYFLPEIGVLWDITHSEQLFVNAQKNVRQFQTSAAAGLSPFALGSQGAFDLFTASAKPETSWTYEIGLRTQRTLSLGPISSFEGQISYYHVDFSNRLLGISPTPVVTAIVSGAAILQNVGSVKTDGVDAAGTLHFGTHFSIYDALSYNNSRYSDDYVSGTATVLTAGKKVPGSPEWLDKFVVSANYGIVDVQAIGDYIGSRYATYTNGLVTQSDGLAKVPGYFTLAGRIGIAVPLPSDSATKRILNLSVNVTNITDKRAASTLSIGAASGTFNEFPLAPRQWFGTVSVSF